MTASARLLLHGAGLLAFMAACVLAFLGDLAAHVPVMLAAISVGLVPLGLVGVAAGRRDGLRRQGGGKVIFVILVWAILLRLLLLAFTEPTLSDDIFRYVWEGRLVAAQIDPYDIAPDDPALTRLALDAPEWPLINHKELPAIYPPAAQWVFGAIASWRAEVGAFRGVMVFIDALLILLLGTLLLSSGRDPRWLVLYAWHPLVVIEVASSGHYEPLAMLPLVAGLFAWHRSRTSPASWLFWGGAIATKYVGGSAAWFAARRLAERGAWGRAFLGLVIAGVTTAVFALPFVMDGTPPIGSLGTYVEHWGHNASVHALLAEVIGYHPARKVVGALFVLWAAYLTWRGPAPGRGFLLLFAGLVVLSPVVHPWYGLWLIVLLPLYPSPPLLALSALLPLSYLAWTTQASGGGWEAPGWVPWVEYGVPLALALALAPELQWRPRAS